MEIVIEGSANSCFFLSQKFKFLFWEEFPCQMMSNVMKDNGLFFGTQCETTCTNSMEIKNRLT